MARKKEIATLKKELNELKEKNASVEQCIKLKRTEIFFRILEEYDTDLDEMEDLLKREKSGKNTDKIAPYDNEKKEDASDFSENKDELEE